MEDYVRSLNTSLRSTPREGFLTRLINSYGPVRHDKILEFIDAPAFSIAKASMMQENMDALIRLYLLRNSDSKQQDIALLEKIKDAGGDQLSSIDTEAFVERFNDLISIENNYYPDISAYVKDYTSFRKESSGKTTKRKIIRIPEPSVEVTSEFYSLHLDVPIYDIFNSICCNSEVPLAAIRWPESESTPTASSSYNYKLFGEFRGDQLHSWIREELSRNQLSIRLKDQTYKRILINQHISNVSSTMTFETGTGIRETLSLLLNAITDPNISAALERGSKNIIERRNTISASFRTTSLSRAIFAYFVRNDTLVKRFISINEQERLFTKATRPRFAVLGYSDVMYECIFVNDVRTDRGKNNTSLSITLFNQPAEVYTQNVEFLRSLVQYMVNHKSQVTSFFNSVLPKGWRRTVALSTKVADSLNDLKDLKRAIPQMADYKAYPYDCEKKKRPKTISREEYEEKTNSSPEEAAKVLKLENGTCISCAHRKKYPFPGYKTGTNNRETVCCFNTKNEERRTPKKTRSSVPSNRNVVGGGHSIRVGNKIPIGAGFYGYLPPSLESVMSIAISKRKVVRYQPATLGDMEGSNITPEGFLACVLVASDVNYIRMNPTKQRDMLSSFKHDLLRHAGPYKGMFEEFLNIGSDLRRLIDEGDSRYLLSICEMLSKTRIYVYTVSDSGKSILPEEPICYGNFVRPNVSKRSCIILKYPAESHLKLDTDIYTVLLQLPEGNKSKNVLVRNTTSLFPDALAGDMWNFCYRPSVIMYGKQQMVESHRVEENTSDDKQLLDPICKRAGQVSNGTFYWTARSSPLIGVTPIKMDSILKTDLHNVPASIVGLPAVSLVKNNGLLFQSDSGYALTNNPGLKRSQLSMKIRKGTSSSLLATETMLVEKGGRLSRKETQYASFDRFYDIYFDAILIRTAIHMYGAGQNLENTIEIDRDAYTRVPSISYIIRNNTGFLRIVNGVIHMYVKDRETKRRIIRLVKTYEFYSPEYVLQYGSSQLYFDWKVPTQLMRQFAGNIILTDRDEAKDYVSRPQENRVYSDVSDLYAPTSKYSFIYRGQLTNNHLTLVKVVESVQEAKEVQARWTAFRRTHRNTTPIQPKGERNLSDGDSYVHSSDIVNYIVTRKHVIRVFLKLG